jgi:transcriptional regulator with XRE-family HTH domain
MARNMSPTVRKRRLAYELRRLRESAGLTIEEVGEKLECSASKISRIETMRVGVTPRDARDLLELYGVPAGQGEELVQLAREARRKGWWEEYGDVVTSPFLGLEAEASSLRAYNAMVIPGLLQTEQYIRALIREGDPHMPASEAERRVSVRMARKALLADDYPPDLRVVLDEAALRRPVGGAEIMRLQIEHLISVTGRPNITLQVIPFSAGSYPGMGGPFVIMAFANPADSDVIYVESAKSSFFLESPDDVENYALRFGDMAATALSQEETVQLLAHVAMGLGRPR